MIKIAAQATPIKTTLGQTPAKGLNLQSFGYRSQFGKIMNSPEKTRHEHCAKP
jgi:hypothetical protein